LLTASSTAGKLAATSPEKCCEKVSHEGNAANKGFDISRKYAASENWFTLYILLDAAGIQTSNSNPSSAAWQAVAWSMATMFPFFRDAEGRVLN
jgi:hypothetical protein